MSVPSHTTHGKSAEDNITPETHWAAKFLANPQGRWLKDKACWSKTERQRIAHGSEDTCKGCTVSPAKFYRVCAKDSVDLTSVDLRITNFNQSWGVPQLSPPTSPHSIFQQIAAPFKDEYWLRTGIEHVFKKNHFLNRKSIKRFMDQHCIMWFDYISEQYRHLLSWIIVGETDNTQLTCKLSKLNSMLERDHCYEKSFIDQGRGLRKGWRRKQVAVVKTRSEEMWSKQELDRGTETTKSDVWRRAF